MISHYSKRCNELPLEKISEVEGRLFTKNEKVDKGIALLRALYWERSVEGG